MIKAILFDYGATLDTFGQHWGMVIWHAYEHLDIPVTEAQYRDAYVYGERTLGSKDIIRPTDRYLPHDSQCKDRLAVRFPSRFRGLVA